MSGTFNCASQLALVSCAYSGLATRADFTFVRYIPTQNFDLLPFDFCVLIRTKCTLAWTSEETPHSGLKIIFQWLITHFNYSFISPVQASKYAWLFYGKRVSSSLVSYSEGT